MRYSPARDYLSAAREIPKRPWVSTGHLPGDVLRQLEGVFTDAVVAAPCRKNSCPRFVQPFFFANASSVSIAYPVIVPPFVT